MSQPAMSSLSGPNLFGESLGSPNGPAAELGAEQPTLHWNHRPYAPTRLPNSAPVWGERKAKPQRPDGPEHVEEQQSVSLNAREHRVLDRALEVLSSPSCSE